MVEINVWLITTSLGVGSILLFVQSNVLLLFIKSYRITKMRQLRIISYSFIFFVIATLSMLTLNLYLSIFYSELNLKEVLALREFSTFIYNVLFAIGLFLLLLSSSEKNMYIYGTTLGIMATFQYIMDERLVVTLELLNKYGRFGVDIIILIEASFLLTLYLTYSEKEVITGKLWNLGILLIMFSRGIDILPTKPYSEMFMIFMDVVAFTLLFLMKKEAEIIYRGTP